MSDEERFKVLRDIFARIDTMHDFGKPGIRKKVIEALETCDGLKKENVGRNLKNMLQTTGLNSQMDTIISSALSLMKMSHDTEEITESARLLKSGDALTVCNVDPLSKSDSYFEIIKIPPKPQNDSNKRSQGDISFRFDQSNYKQLVCGGWDFTSANPIKTLEDALNQGWKLPDVSSAILNVLSEQMVVYIWVRSNKPITTRTPTLNAPLELIQVTSEGASFKDGKLVIQNYELRISHFNQKKLHGWRMDNILDNEWQTNPSDIAFDLLQTNCTIWYKSSQGIEEEIKIKKVVKGEQDDKAIVNERIELLPVQYTTERIKKQAQEKPNKKQKVSRQAQDGSPQWGFSSFSVPIDVNTTTLHNYHNQFMKDNNKEAVSLILQGLQPGCYVDVVFVIDDLPKTISCLILRKSNILEDTDGMKYIEVDVAEGDEMSINTLLLFDRFYGFPHTIKRTGWRISLADKPAWPRIDKLLKLKPIINTSTIPYPKPILQLKESENEEKKLRKQLQELKRKNKGGSIPGGQITDLNNKLKTNLDNRVKILEDFYSSSDGKLLSIWVWWNFPKEGARPIRAYITLIDDENHEHYDPSFISCQTYSDLDNMPSDFHLYYDHYEQPITDTTAPGWSFYNENDDTDKVRARFDTTADVNTMTQSIKTSKLERHTCYFFEMLINQCFRDKIGTEETCPRAFISQDGSFRYTPVDSQMLRIELPSVHLSQKKRRNMDCNPAEYEAYYTKQELVRIATFRIANRFFQHDIDRLFIMTDSGDISGMKLANIYNPVCSLVQDWDSAPSKSTCSITIDGQNPVYPSDDKRGDLKYVFYSNLLNDPRQFYLERNQSGTVAYINNSPHAIIKNENDVQKALQDKRGKYVLINRVQIEKAIMGQYENSDFKLLFPRKQNEEFNSDNPEHVAYGLDVKRSGDSLKVLKMAHMSSDEENMYVYSTHDRMAFLHARMLQVPVIYTHPNYILLFKPLSSMTTQPMQSGGAPDEQNIVYVNRLKDLELHLNRLVGDVTPRLQQFIAQMKLPQFNVSRLELRSTIIQYIMNIFNDTACLELEFFRQLKFKVGEELYNKMREHPDPIKYDCQDLYMDKLFVSDPTDIYNSAYYIHLKEICNDLVHTLIYSSTKFINQAFDEALVACLQFRRSRLDRLNWNLIADKHLASDYHDIKIPSVPMLDEQQLKNLCMRLDVEYNHQADYRNLVFQAPYSCFLIYTKEGISPENMMHMLTEEEYVEYSLIYGVLFENANYAPVSQTYYARLHGAVQDIVNQPTIPESVKKHLLAPLEKVVAQQSVSVHGGDSPITPSKSSFFRNSTLRSSNKRKQHLERLATRGMSKLVKSYKEETFF